MAREREFASPTTQTLISGKKKKEKKEDGWMDKIILSKQSLDRSALLPHKASFPFLILYVMEKMYFCLKNGPCFLQ